VIRRPTPQSGYQGFIDPGGKDDPSNPEGESEEQYPEPQALSVGVWCLESRVMANPVVACMMPRRCLCIQLGLADLDRHGHASVGLIQTSEASVRQPPPATGIAAQEGRVRCRCRLHVSPASRAESLCCNRDASCVTNRPLQRGVIFDKKVHLSDIEPESVSGGTDIEPRAMASWNLSQVLLTIGAFHSNHRIQTVARIGQVSTQCASNRLEKQGFRGVISGQL